MGYNNSQYWLGLHQKYGARLATVGYPYLSEHFNTLKYASEAETVLDVLENVSGSLAGARKLKVLDVGAGTGYWTCLVRSFLQERGFDLSLSALDISQEALEGIKQQLPEAEVIQQDLKEVSPDLLRDSYDLVYSFYCLHHIPRLDDFANAVRFSGRSVAPGGYLMVMDPVLTMPYSRLDSFDFFSYGGNGVARHLYVLDDLLQREGFVRKTVHPAVSFLLNSNIEARHNWSFAICNKLWQSLQYFYRSERRTNWVAGMVRWLDRICKRKNWSYSSSVCVFQKDRRI